MIFSQKNIFKTEEEDLANIDRNFNYPDCFRHLYGHRREYTWEGRESPSASRLDRFFIPDTMATALINMSHHAGFSDHTFGIMKLELKKLTNYPNRSGLDLDITR